MSEEKTTPNSLDKLFEDAIGLMAGEEGTMQVPVDASGNVNPSFLLNMFVGLKSDLIMLKAQMLCIWSAQRDAYEKLPEDSQRVVYESFRAELGKLQGMYAEAKEERAKPKLATPTSKILTP